MNPEMACSFVLTSWETSYDDKIERYLDANLSRTTLGMV